VSRVPSLPEGLNLRLPRRMSRTCKHALSRRRRGGNEEGQEMRDNSWGRADMMRAPKREKKKTEGESPSRLFHFSKVAVCCAGRGAGAESGRVGEWESERERERE
jgi:hypothetical protein